MLFRLSIKLGDERLLMKFVGSRNFARQQSLLIKSPCFEGLVCENDGTNKLPVANKVHRGQREINHQQASSPPLPVVDGKAC